MLKKCIYLRVFCVFCIAIQNDVHGAEGGRSIRDFCASIFQGGSCQNAVYVTEREEETTSALLTTCCAAESERADQLKGSQTALARKSNKINAATRAKIFAEIERIAKDSEEAPEQTVSIRDDLTQDYDESVAILTLAEFCAVNLDTVEGSRIRTLTIIDRLSERNKEQLFLKIKTFKNIEELTLRDCWDLEEIPVGELGKLPHLRCLALYNIFMDARYVGGYHDAGIKISNLVDIVNMQRGKQLILQSEDFTDKQEQTLRECAAEKGVTISVLKKWPFERERRQKSPVATHFSA